MNREILFRGKDILTGRWLYGFPYVYKVKDGPTDYIEGAYMLQTNEWMGFADVFVVKSKLVRDVDKKTVTQFTGFSTKRVKSNLDPRVFEGDIFRATKETEDGEDITSYNVVMWIPQRGAFYMVPVEHYEVLKDNDCENSEEFSWLFDDAMLSDFSMDVMLTKVGNVFDNPELMI